MSKKIPAYLKLVASAPLEVVPSRDEDFSLLSAACEAFRDATGWRLHYHEGPATTQNKLLAWSAPVDPGVGASPGHLRIVLDDAVDDEPSGQQAARCLASAIANLWSEVLSTRGALWQREAELATQVPVTARSDEATKVAERLEGVLRSGAETVGCQAAALYMLDPGTTELKLRASWGLPRRRLVDAARPLQGSLADLEALLGHAVVLEDNQLFGYWKVPEPFAAAVCLPVSSPTIPLGTVWFFSDVERDFSEAQTGMLEVVAGRLAADLEREVLVGESATARREVVAQHADSSWQQRLPSVGPSLDGWEVAGSARLAGTTGGVFYDWFSQSGDSLSVVVGAAERAGINGALTATAMRACARTHSPQAQSSEPLLQKINSVLWSGSSGSESAGLLHATLSPGNGAVQYSSAGALQALVVRRTGAETLVGPSPALGVNEQLPAGLNVQPQLHSLADGEALVIYGLAGLAERDLPEWLPFAAALGSVLQSELIQPAGTLADLASRAIATHLAATTDAPVSADHAVLVIKRRAR